VAKVAYTLSILDGAFGICRLESGSETPDWVPALDFFSITRTREELSIVAPEDDMRRAELPAEASIEGGWACLKVEGPLDLSLVGVLAELSGTLAEAGISIFAVSTYDTDYLLVRDEDLPAAVAALSAAGHTVAGG
jgi:hypothetical protein